MKKWLYVVLSSILGLLGGLGISVLLISGRLKSSPLWKIVYSRGLIVGMILALIMLLLGYLLIESSTRCGGDTSPSTSFTDLIEEMRKTIVKAKKNKEIRQAFIDYLKSMWVDDNSKPFVDRALKEIVDEFSEEAWLLATYAELLMSDGRWTDAEIMIKRAWESAPTDEYVRQVVRQWIDARSSKDPFRVSEMVRRLREVHPEGWLYLLEAEHMMKIGRRGKIEEVLMEAYKLSDDDLSLFEVISAYLGYLVSEGMETQMFAFFERLKQIGIKPILYAIEAKLAILVGDYERALSAYNRLKESGASQELIDLIVADIMNSARKDGKYDIIERLFD